MPVQQTIPNQVKLPFSVAVGVVLQGIRIRLGRSLVTISGVVLGIAFLMSILTGQIIKDGVREEQQLRDQLGRMTATLIRETGPLAGKWLLVHGAQSNELTELESRFLQRLEDEGVQIESTAAASDTREYTAEIWLGPDATVAVPDLQLKPKTDLVFAIRPVTHRDDVLPLNRELREDEKAAAAAQASRDQVRSIWIITISLLVTVIGITNAMLMSVTERFREIGTMKCLGALSSFVRRLFLIESSLMGLVGGIAGAIGGALFAMVAYGLSFGVLQVLGSLDALLLVIYLLGSIVVAIVLSVIAALYPAAFAARMVPADALRSNI